jgi:hypothetical protein
MKLRAFASAIPLAFCIACDEGSESKRSSTASPDADTCASADSPACWQQVEPPGRAVFPDEWQDGKWPQTLLPVVAFNSEIWMTNESHAWSSRDGITYTRHDKTDWQGRLSPNYVFFKNQLWLIGGMELVGSDFEKGVFNSVVWSSSDGVTWKNAGAAAWPPRKSTAVAVYHDALWIFGGANGVAADGASDAFLNDVWTSPDGVTWTEVTAAAPWAARADPGIEVFNDELFLVGGQGYNDVWRSKDGKNWTQVVAEAEWNMRHDQGTAVFDGKLWVFGGYVGDHRNAQNDVWHSADGRSWKRQGERAPWAPRSGAHTAVFAEKLWMFSGKHTGSQPVWKGDIWAMSAVSR